MNSQFFILIDLFVKLVVDNLRQVN